MAAASADHDQARALWSAITGESPRWLDSRLALIELDREQLDLEEINPDRHRLTELFHKAEAFAKRSLLEAHTEADKTELMLALARLDLTPSVGKPEAARDLCERLVLVPGTTAHQYRRRG